MYPAFKKRVRDADKLNQTDLFSRNGQIVEDTFSNSLTEKKQKNIRTGKKKNTHTNNKQTNNQRNIVRGKERELNNTVHKRSSVTALEVVLKIKNGTKERTINHKGARMVKDGED